MERKNMNVVICPPCGESTLKGGKGVVNEDTFMDNPPSALRATSPAGGEVSGGFTLIELLVVVLIIGILAAIALPQYKKAVMKSRFTQWVTYMSNMDKALNTWILNNGYPENTIYFTGENPDASLDIDMTCFSVSGTYCYTHLGRFVVGCNSENCWIDFGTTYEGYKGVFPSGNSIWTAHLSDGSFNNQRVLTLVPSDVIFRKIVCEWWTTHYGKNRMTERATTSCSEVGI